MNSLLHTPQSSNNLLCTIISLNDWKIVKIQGKDTIQYLQGQLTCNMNKINKNQYTLAAHCNHNGKIISNMYVLFLNTGIALIERDSICSKQIKEMKKYAIFSKVDIAIDNQIMLYGVAGINARITLNKFFKTLPNNKQLVISDNEILILYIPFPKERFLLIVPYYKQNIITMLKNNMQTSNSMQWNALDIEAGYPIINIVTTEKITPQAANMHLLDGISFNKGCYIGQEIIARIKYKNTNKKSLYWLIGDCNTVLPQSGNNLEMKIKQNWKPTGLILESCKMSTGEIWIQAILKNSISYNHQLRIPKEQTQLRIANLPYLVLT